MKKLNFIIVYFLNFFTFTSCWQFFTTFSDLVMTSSYPVNQVVHSQYIFGHCENKDKIKFYCHHHLDSVDVLGKIIIRGWIDVIRIPTCIILRARAFEEETFRSTTYNFQICVPRIGYCHTHKRFLYYYYEWYIPEDLIGGMNWDIYFFGPPNREW